MGFSISKKGIALIKEFEGLELQSYRCASNVLTIGYGHTSGVKEDMTITTQQADEFLYQDLDKFENAVNRLVGVAINQNEFDALVSFTFNVGTKAFTDSTMLKKLNLQKPKKEVAEEFGRWVNGADGPLEGLVRRREAEEELFLTEQHSATVENFITAKQNTWLKRAPVQSSDLEAEEKCYVPRGAAHRFASCVVDSESDHLKVVLLSGTGCWYAYAPHWDLSYGYRSPEKTSERLLVSTPYFSQRDNYRDEMRTCFSSSNAMLLEQARPGSIENDDDYIEIVFSKGDTTEAWAQMSALKDFGLDAEFKTDGDWDAVEAQLRRGYCVPIGILHHGTYLNPTGGGHWIVVIGMERNNIICHDPYGCLDIRDGGYINDCGEEVLYSKPELTARWLIEGSKSGWFVEV